MATRIDLKRGSLGDVYCEKSDDAVVTVRDLRAASWPKLARYMASREAKALTRLGGIGGVPKLIALEKNRLIRSFLPGEVMYQAAPDSREYFREALRLVRRLHREGVTHNDLAKEANWICDQNNAPGIVDFQLAICFSRRTRWFRLLAREDLRHLLKHKRHYLPGSLTRRELHILATPRWPARYWMALVKPGYRFFTRRLLGWHERDSAIERQRPQ